jgi:DNA-directed RNA polymerase subunit M/transcription elongation factor TFIIS
MVPPKKTVTCEKCWNSKATLTVTAEGWEDAPKTFTFTRECPACGKSYAGGILAENMHELTGLPLTGWAS